MKNKFWKQNHLKIIILAFFIFGGFLNSAKTQTKSIILGRPTNNSITASIMFDQNVQYYLEYGTVSGNYSLKSATITNILDVPEEIDLTNLLANTKYYYRMQFKLINAANYTSTPEYSFTTQRLLGSSFTFTVEADEHLYDIKGHRGMYQTTLANEALDNPDFMISLGDIFGDDHIPIPPLPLLNSDDMKALHKDYRQYLGLVCPSIPFYVCLGNHEGENDYYLNQNPPNNIGVWGTQWRKYYYPNPYPNSFYSGNTVAENYGINTPENYYSWTWGDALFVVLDVYRTEISPGTNPADPAKPTNWDWTLGKTQYDWMREVLEKSNAEHKFVFAHHTRGQGRGGIITATQFEWGGIDGNQNKFAQYRPGWGKPIHQVFMDTGVDIFFQGHDHLFAKEELNGVIYQEVPMPSDSSYKIGYLANSSAYPNGNAMDGTGHIRVNVTPTCVKVDFVKAYLAGTSGAKGHTNGEVAFSYTIGTCKEEPKQKDFFTIFPNPAKDNLTIQFANNNKARLVKLQNAWGQTLLQTNSNVMNVSQIPNGIYFLNIDSEQGPIVKTIVVYH